MQLSAFHGSALNFACRCIPPLQSREGLGAVSTPAHSSRPLVKATSDRLCPGCVEGAPGYRASSWRLQVHVVCTQHRTPLTVHADSAEDSAIDDAVCDSQDEVLRRLGRPKRTQPSSTSSMINSIQPWDCGEGTRSGKRTGLRSRYLRSFVDPWRRLAHGYPDYQGFGDSPVPRAIRHLRPAHMLASNT